jgi:hypothetical protein
MRDNEAGDVDQFPLPPLMSTRHEDFIRERDQLRSEIEKLQKIIVSATKIVR